MRKNIKKLIVISVLSFLLVNTVVYAAQPELYTSIINRITAVKNAILNKETTLTNATDEAVQKLEDYVKDYESDIESELVNHEQKKLEEAKRAINDEVNSVINDLEDVKANLIEEYKKEIDTKIDNDLEKQLATLKKQFE